MSKEKLAAVRELINQKRFSEARAILETIDDDPSAQALLRQLDRKAPRSRPQGNSGCLGYVLTVFASAVLTSALIAAMVFFTAPERPASRGAAATRQPAEPPPTEIPTVRVGVVQSSQSVNVRSGPGTNFERVATLPPNAEVAIMDDSSNREWYNVRLSDDSTGWVRADLLDVRDVPLDEAPAVAAISPEPTEDPTPEPTPLPVCTPEEARAWWQGAPLYAQANHAWLEAREKPDASISDIIARLENDRATYEFLPYPPCAEGVRADVLAGAGAMLAALRTLAAGDAEAAAQQVETAREETFAAALQTLTADLGVAFSSTTCGAEFWYGVVAADVNLFLDLVAEAGEAEAGSDTARTGVFRMQDIRRQLAEPYFPLCASRARESLLSALDEGADLYRAVFDGDAGRIQQFRNGVNVQRGAFFQELNRLGVRQ
jgi:hypothetical protein